LKSNNSSQTTFTAAPSVAANPTDETPPAGADPDRKRLRTIASVCLHVAANGSIDDVRALLRDAERVLNLRAERPQPARAFPEIGQEPFNASPADIESAWVPDAPPCPKCACTNGTHRILERSAARCLCPRGRELSAMDRTRGR
jgi:hypothetical protein